MFIYVYDIIYFGAFVCTSVGCMPPRTGDLLGLLHCWLHFGNNLEFIALKGIWIFAVQFSEPAATMDPQRRDWQDKKKKTRASKCECSEGNDMVACLKKTKRLLKNK